MKDYQPSHHQIAEALFPNSGDIGLPSEQKEGPDPSLDLWEVPPEEQLAKYEATTEDTEEDPMAQMISELDKLQKNLKETQKNILLFNNHAQAVVKAAAYSDSKKGYGPRMPLAVNLSLVLGEGFSVATQFDNLLDAPSNPAQLPAFDKMLKEYLVKKMPQIAGELVASYSKQGFATIGKITEEIAHLSAPDEIVAEEEIIGASEEALLETILTSEAFKNVSGVQIGDKLHPTKELKAEWTTAEEIEKPKPTIGIDMAEKSDKTVAMQVLPKKIIKKK